MRSTSYRLRIARDILRIIVLPSAVLTAILSHRPPSPAAAVPCYIAFIVLWGYTKGLYYDRQERREAARLGARTIPRVVGKWPGNVDVLLKMMKAFRTSYIMDVYLDLFEEHQSSVLNLRILWKDQIITMDEQHAKFVLSTGFDKFWRGYAQKERMETFLGKGIFNRDDEVWSMHRSMTRPFFARERISDFDVFEKHSVHALTLLSSFCTAGRACDVQDLFARFSLDAASEFLFGLQLATLAGALPSAGSAVLGAKGSATSDAFGRFAQGFDEAQQVATTRARLGHWVWPLVEMGGDRSRGPQRRIREWLDPLVERVLEEKRRAKRGGVESPIGDKTFLQHLADSTDDRDLIRDQLLSVLLASRDTTACLLTYVVYFMALHPEVTARLRAEVLARCGPHRAPTYDDIRDMKYLRAVLKETLRLFPPVPLNVRESRATPCTLPRPAHAYPGDSGAEYYMPPRTVIMYFPLLIQRDRVLWGADADAFDPDRWLDARLARYTQNPLMYTPFSAGPRICLGQNYALNEASYFLVRLLQQFDGFTLVPEAQPAGSRPPEEWKAKSGRQAFEQVWPAAAMTLFIKGGLWVRFHKVADP